MTTTQAEPRTRQEYLDAAIAAYRAGDVALSSRLKALSVIAPTTAPAAPDPQLEADIKQLREQIAELEGDGRIGSTGRLKVQLMQLVERRTKLRG